MGAPQPSEVTARAEPVASANAGEFACPTGTCTGTVRLRVAYDDPLQTPVTELPFRFANSQGAILAQDVKTTSLTSLGVTDGTDAVPENRPLMGIAEQADMSRATPILAFTGTTPEDDDEDIISLADDAWEAEKAIVASLGKFETSMTAMLFPYVLRWETEGATGAVKEYFSGIGDGVESWWNAEKDFWGSAWGWLKSTTVSVISSTWNAVTNPIETAQRIWEGVNEVHEQLGNLTEFMRGLLFGSVDTIYETLKSIGEALKDVAGDIGEFGQFVWDAIQKGQAWWEALIENIRRTPILGLIANSAMRVLMMMTPNFWAELGGKGVGFLIPEIIIFIIGAVITYFSAGAGAPALAARGTKLLITLTKLFGKGGVIIKKFVTTVGKIIQKVGDLVALLKKTMVEKAQGVIDSTQLLFRSSKYWRRKLDELARQGHGPQRHEGDVTDRGLKDRTMFGINPEDGSIGLAPRTATKINTPADYVRAYEYVLKHPKYKKLLADAKVNGDDRFAISVSDGIKLSDIFGPNFQSRVRGYTRVGSANNPIGTTLTDLSDSKIVAVFTKGTSGEFGLLTLFPKL